MIGFHGLIIEANPKLVLRYGKGCSGKKPVTGYRMKSEADQKSSGEPVKETRKPGELHVDFSPQCLIE